MQHQLLDIFQFDNVDPGLTPKYYSADNKKHDILVMNGDGSFQKGKLGVTPDTGIQIPLFPMSEPWKLSHKTPQGMQSLLETFISSFLGQIEPIMIDSILEIKSYINNNGHIVAGTAIRNAEGMEQICRGYTNIYELVNKAEASNTINDRRCVFLKSMDPYTIMICPEPEETGIFSYMGHVQPGTNNVTNREIGFFLLPKDIKVFKLQVA
jgi:hypothetical protein